MESDTIPSKSTIKYANWIKDSKLKLKERESTIIFERSQLTSYVINQALNEFSERHNLWIKPDPFVIDNKLILNALRVLFVKLDTWKGINLCKSKKEYTNFSHYFLQAKKWWDNYRQSIYGEHYWINVFNSIYTHVRIYSNRHYGGKPIFNSSQAIYIKCLFIKVLQKLFTDTIGFDSTRALPLLSISIIKRCHAIQNYLYRQVDESLNIAMWITQEQERIKSTKSVTNKKNQYTSVKSIIISTWLNNAFNILSRKLENEFEHHIQVRYYELIKIIFDNTVGKVQLIGGETMENVDNCNNYCGIHRSTNNASNSRYSPMY